MSNRRFHGAPAVRASIPLWIGLYGPSGAGKTYSGLRLAKGIQSIVGGKIGCGDTENGRAAHYASEFDFQRYPFDPPFDPLSYLDLLEQMASDGITVAIVDSASHEHEGEGGVLEMHAAECKRLAAQWRSTEDKVKMSAWAVPKTEHRRMIQGALRLPLHVIWCFRAKEKLQVIPGKTPKKLGFMPIASDDLVYEMAMTALLMPGAMGVPTWASDEIGERMMIKLPHWARDMLRSGVPIDEQLGAALARWAQGDIGVDTEADRLIAAVTDCQNSETLESTLTAVRRAWRGLDDASRKRVTATIEEVRARIAPESEAS